MRTYNVDGQESLFAPDGSAGKTLLMHFNT